MMAQPTRKVQAMRRKFGVWFASWLRWWADFVDPSPVTVVDRIYPTIRELVRAAEVNDNAGAIKELIVMKAYERIHPEVSRLDIKDAINKAVRVLRNGD